MKIGVALAGCDIGGISAWSALNELRELGFEIGMLSVCGTPAAGAAIYARGSALKDMRSLSESFLNDSDEKSDEAAVKNLASKLSKSPVNELPLAINAVNVENGEIITFTNEFELQTEKLKTCPMPNPLKALLATVSLADGLATCPEGDRRLCDFSCWYGSPVYPLKMAGYKKILSLAFVPKFPKTPYEALVKRMLAANASAADVHIPVEFAKRGQPLDYYLQTAAAKIKSQSKSLCFKMLF